MVLVILQACIVADVVVVFKSGELRYRGQSVRPVTKPNRCEAQLSWTVVKLIPSADGHISPNAPDLFQPPKLKQLGACLVLAWGTCWEALRVLVASLFAM